MDLVWRLSEIIDPIILHCHPGEKTISEYFRDIYKKGINEKLFFSEIMKNLWDKTKENEKEIAKF